MTKWFSKHVLPVGKEPMMFNPIRSMVGAGVTDIHVIMTPNGAGMMMDICGDGKELGANLTFQVQPSDKGTAWGVHLCKERIGKHSILVVLADNILTDTTALKEHVDSFDEGAKVIVKEMDDPSAFAVAEIEGDTIVRIEEKPEEPKSNLAVLGYRMYDHRIFDVIPTLPISPRGVYELPDATKWYIHHSRCEYGVLKGGWYDAGTHEDWLAANHALIMG
jgi:glucose-1-phosphate thymidylyltransferase